MLIDGATLADAVSSGALEVYRTNVFGNETRLTPRDLKIGSNSIDVTLGHSMLYSALHTILDPYDNTLRHHGAPLVDTPNGRAFMIMPQTVYLGFAAERFVVKDMIKGGHVVQMLDGRSTVGRIGIMVHVTAGFGDLGFAGNFTLEVVNLNRVPVLLYPGMRIGQVAFHQISSHPDQIQYAGSYGADHVGRPVPPVLGKTRFC